MKLSNHLVSLENSILSLIKLSASPRTSRMASGSVLLESLPVRLLHSLLAQFMAALNTTVSLQLRLSRSRIAFRVLKSMSVKDSEPRALSAFALGFRYTYPFPHF